MRKIISISVMGAIALTALPVFAQESSSSSATTASSAAASAASSEGQRPKGRCQGISGKELADCVHEILMGRGKAMGQAIKKAKKNCTMYRKGTPEFRACTGVQKASVKSAYKEMRPSMMNRTNTIMDHIKKKRRNREASAGSTASASSSASSN